MQSLLLLQQNGFRILISMCARQGIQEVWINETGAGVSIPDRWSAIKVFMVHGEVVAGASAFFRAFMRASSPPNPWRIVSQVSRRVQALKLSYLNGCLIHLLNCLGTVMIMPPLSQFMMWLLLLLWSLIVDFLFFLRSAVSSRSVWSSCPLGLVFQFLQSMVYRKLCMEIPTWHCLYDWFYGVFGFTSCCWTFGCGFPTTTTETNKLWIWSKKSIGISAGELSSLPGTLSSKGSRRGGGWTRAFKIKFPSLVSCS